MEVRDKISALILAAGFSSRMGAFKPLLPLGGTTVIERSVSVFKSAGIRDITVVVGHRAEELMSVLKPMHVNIALNHNYADGMFSSVKAGVESINSTVEAFFLLPGDIPLIKQNTLAEILKVYDNRAGIIYPCLDGQRGHPPLISTRYKDMILSYNETGGLRALLQQYEPDARDVEVTDQGILMDMDTPADYQQVLERVTGNIPTKSECLTILNNNGVPDKVVRHCQAVSRVAEKIARNLNNSGYNLNIDLIQAAGLLHDLGKGKKDHARAGAEFLRDLGYPGVAEAVACHMDIVPDPLYPITEATVLYLADKLVKDDRVVSLKQRFQEIQERFAEQPNVLDSINKRLNNALEIKKHIEKVIRLPLDVNFFHEGFIWNKD